jgi:ribosomal protein S18 acetylase RimI-like enzyme
MNIKIVKAEPDDVSLVCDLFEKAIHFVKISNYIGWKNYDVDFIKTDIGNGLLYKIVVDAEVAGIFSVCYTDKLIWRERETGNAMYLHRIVLNRDFKGVKIFNIVLDWAIRHAALRNLDCVRMDTWADNEKLINYYKTYGFRFIENYTTGDTSDLPIQHRNLKVALLELDLNRHQY